MTTTSAEAESGTFTDESSVTLSQPARLSVLAGLLLWVLAGGFFYMPTFVTADKGVRLNCESAANPVTDQQALCGPITQQRRVQAITVLIAGFVVAVGGAVAFGAAGTRSSAQPDDDSQA